ncbi:MAG: DUF4419 domain-containing protein [Prevotellaceae bacterium]|nr:DUF4419 domain-containing protein [Candidatus Minthosoma equi]
MKRILFTLFLAIIAVSTFAKEKKNVVIKQTEGSITFVVDENLPAPNGHLNLQDGAQIANWRVGDGKERKTIVATSFDDVQFYHTGDNAMFSMLMMAYAHHRPLILSPDDVWLCISQGFAQHVNQNAEALRDKLVSHEGKITLSVETSQLLLGKEDVGVDTTNLKPIDWPKIFDGFVAQMKANAKGNIVDNMCANFTTTTVDSRIASQITLMNAMQPYFNYEVFRVACGIPYITIKGTPEDWQKVLDKARSLEQYDLKWWTDRLCPVLEEFVKTAQGKPDHQFWRCMMTQIEIDKIRGGGCSNVMPTLFDGWFLALFPYDTKGRTPEKITKSRDMLNSVKSADFLYRVQDAMGNTVLETPMQFHAGFVGIDENQDTYELKARIGWIVRKAPKKEGEK